METPVVSRFRNALRLGANYLTLDTPDNLGLHYQGQYIRYSKNERIILIGSIGYLVAKNEEDPLRPFDRRRVTTDASVAVAPFKMGKQHNLRIGAGISIWYRNDTVVDRLSYSVRADGTYYNINIQMREVKALDAGSHCLAEHEYNSKANFMGTVRVGLANPGRAGYSSILSVD